MYLLDVRVEIDPSHERELNEWYYTHVPRLVSIPGYESGRRYVALTEAPRYAALYEIEDASYLSSLLGADPDKRHPLTLSEWDAWDRSLVPHMRHGSTNLYRRPDESGDAILTGDQPIVEARLDVMDGVDLDDLCEMTIWPALVATGEFTSMTRLTAAQEPEVEWLETSPRDLILLEARNDEKTAELAGHDGSVASIMGDLVRAGTVRDLEIAGYRQIARHWTW